MKFNLEVFKRYHIKKGEIIYWDFWFWRDLKEKTTLKKNDSSQKSYDWDKSKKIGICNQFWVKDSKGLFLFKI